MFGAADKANMTSSERELNRLLDESLKRISEAAETSSDLERLLADYLSNGKRFRYVISRGPESVETESGSLKRLLEKTRAL